MDKAYIIEVITPTGSYYYTHSFDTAFEIYCKYLTPDNTKRCIIKILSKQGEYIIADGKTSSIFDNMLGL